MGLGPCGEGLRRFEYLPPNHRTSTHLRRGAICDSRFSRQQKRGRGRGPTRLKRKTKQTTSKHASCDLPSMKLSLRSVLSGECDSQKNKYRNDQAWIEAPDRNLELCQNLTLIRARGISPNCQHLIHDIYGNEC